MIWSLLLTGCFSSTDPTYDVCEIALVAETSEVSAGSSVRISATPLTDLRDTSVRLDGIAVAVTEIERNDLECTLCASCRSTNECGACSTCTECTEICDGCAESFTIVVPEDTPTGSVELSLSNAYGAGTTELLIQPAIPIPTDTATNP